MRTDDSARPGNFLSNVTSLLPELEALYKDIHSHPELSLQETRTAAMAAGRLRSAGYEVASGIGKTGVVGVLRNGPGPTVLLRADLYALAALAAAIIVALGHVIHISPIATTIIGGFLCFALRNVAIRHGWHLPAASPPRGQSKESSVQESLSDNRRFLIWKPVTDDMVQQIGPTP